MSTGSSLLRWLLALAITAPMLTAVCLVAVVSRATGRKLLRVWCRWVATVFGIDVALENPERAALSGPIVFVQLNQGSLLDGMIWTVAMPPTRGIVNLEYALLPFVGWATAAAGAIVVVRQWPTQAKRAIAKAASLLRRGSAIAISIEGRRSVDGTLMPYKKGPAVLAIQTGATIVPVFFSEGARRCLPFGEWRVRPSNVRLTLCEPIDTLGMSIDDRDALVERLRGVAHHCLTSRL